MAKEKLFARLEDRLYEVIKDNENIGMATGLAIVFAGTIVKNNDVAVLGGIIFGTSAGYAIYKENTEDDLR